MSLTVGHLCIELNGRKDKHMEALPRNMYVPYLKDFSNPIVVFDGYNNISSKYSTHEM